MLQSTDGRLTSDGGYVRKMVAELGAQLPDKLDTNAKEGRKVNRLKEMFEKGSPDSASSAWRKDGHAEHHLTGKSAAI